MICSFTQTYSNNRYALYNYHNKDKVDIYFRNKMDKNFYAFHNSPYDYQQEILKNSYFSDINPEIIRYDNISYTQSFLQSLSIMQSEGFKYMFFLQDDVFSRATNEDIDNLLDYIKTNDFDMLNLEAVGIASQYKYDNNNLKIYDTTSDDFMKTLFWSADDAIYKNMWAFDDSPYVAKISFLFDAIYDKEYFEKNDICNAEWHLKYKIEKSPVQRLTTNVQFFERIGIVGPNAWNAHNELKKLCRLFS